jgi:hypothetical protein
MNQSRVIVSVEMDKNQFCVVVSFMMVTNQSIFGPNTTPAKNTEFESSSYKFCTKFGCGSCPKSPDPDPDAQLLFFFILRTVLYKNEAAPTLTQGEKFYAAPGAPAPAPAPILLYRKQKKFNRIKVNIMPDNHFPSDSVY